MAFVFTFLLIAVLEMKVVDSDPVVNDTAHELSEESEDCSATPEEK